MQQVPTKTEKQARDIITTWVATGVLVAQKANVSSFCPPLAWVLAQVLLQARSL